MIEIKKITGVLLLILIIFAMQGGIINAQTPVLINNEQFREDASMAIDSLYNRNAEASGVIMGEWKNRYPDHPIWEMWDAIELGGSFLKIFMIIQMTIVS
jgi:hypothetical protein